MGQQSPLSAIDTEQLIKYIEKLVNSLQTIEKVVGAIFSRKSSDSQVMKEAHLQVIEIVSESSLKLAQMPELHQFAEDVGPAEEPQDRIETFMKVYETMQSW